MAFFAQQARRVAWGSDDKKSEGEAAAVAPHVKRLSRSAPLSLFIEALEQDGCVIIKDFTDKETIEQAGQEVRPWLEKQDSGATVGGKRENSSSMQPSLQPFLIFFRSSSARKD